MKLSLTGCAAALGLMTALLGAGAGSASAAQNSASPQATVTQAVAARPMVHPNFTCSSPTVCLYPNDNYTGNYPNWGGPATLATDKWNGVWYTFNDASASNPNPGSLNDDSNSVMWVYSQQLGNIYACLTPGKWQLNNEWGYFYIMYGVTSCPAYHPAGP